MPETRVQHQERFSDRLIRQALDLFGLAGVTDRAESRRDKLLRLAPPAAAMGFILSLMVHLVAWLVAAFVTVQGAQAGGAGALDGAPVQVAVTTEAELRGAEQTSIEVDAPAIQEQPTDELVSGVQLEIAIPDALPGGTLGGGMPGDAGDLIGGLGAGDVSGTPGMGLGGAGGGAASFFGVEARGTRFAYVVDVSGSMGVGGKIDSLKRELTKSVDALLENAFYYIVSFSSDALPLGGRREWIESSDAGKAWGRKNIAPLGSSGGTEPWSGFALVFAMRPRPDAIYFMTDGQFDPKVVLQIATVNDEFRIPIHCIAFGTKEAEALMRKIAADSGGSYTYVPGAGG